MKPGTRFCHSIFIACASVLQPGSPVRSLSHRGSHSDGGETFWA